MRDTPLIADGDSALTIGAPTDGLGRSTGGGRRRLLLDSRKLEYGGSGMIDRLVAKTEALVAGGDDEEGSFLTTEAWGVIVAAVIDIG